MSFNHELFSRLHKSVHISTINKQSWDRKNWVQVCVSLS